MPGTQSNSIQTQPGGSLLQQVPAKKKGNSQFIVQGLVALGMIIATFVAAFVLYIPYIQDIQDLREKQKTVRAEVARLDDKYNQINGMGRDQLDAYLGAAVKFVPDDIKLGDLGIFVNNNAEKFDLQVFRLNLNENKTDVRTELNIVDTKAKVIASQGDKQILLGKISGPFGLSGQKKDIFRFLDFLVDGGYASEFDKVDIVPGDNNTWAVTFTAVNHFLAPAKGVPPETALLKPRIDLLTPPTGDEPTTSVTPTPSK